MASWRRPGAIALLLSFASLLASAAQPQDAKSRLSIEERVHSQREIERVFWKHRAWPEGDLCDLDDALILQFRSNRDSIEWQADSGLTSWNVYEGDKVAFSLVTGEQGAGETPLGTDGSGNPRPNANPCP